MGAERGVETDRPSPWHPSGERRVRPTPAAFGARGRRLVARRMGPYDCSVASSDAPLALDRAGLDAVVSAHEPGGSTLVGPTVSDRAIALDQIGATAEPPAGRTDVHDAEDQVPRELRARLAKPPAERRDGPDAGRAPSP
jgi:hypothetical protein